VYLCSDSLCIFLEVHNCLADLDIHRIQHAVNVERSFQPISHHHHCTYVVSIVTKYHYFTLHYLRGGWPHEQPKSTEATECQPRQTSRSTESLRSFLSLHLEMPTVAATAWYYTKQASISLDIVPSSALPMSNTLNVKPLPRQVLHYPLNDRLTTFGLEAARRKFSTDKSWGTAGIKRSRKRGHLPPSRFVCPGEHGKLLQQCPWVDRALAENKLCVFLASQNTGV